jgi:general secretion pathway protein A
MAQTVTVYDESAYLEFLGLDRNPFPVSPDNQNFFLSRRIDQVLTDILHGITARKGFIVLSGDIGLGKTTISRRVISTLEQQGVATSLVLNSFYQDLELLIEINRDFGLKSKKALFGDQMRLLRHFLLAQNRRGKNCAIIIDDAQNLNLQSLELVRMISNLEADQTKLVQILLIGQPELLKNLEQPMLRQLKSRIIIKEVVHPLTQDELQGYILYKLALAGNRGLIEIQNSAFEKIHQTTRGNFRQVNILMERCLYVACLQNSTLIDTQIVSEAHRDLNLDAVADKKPVVKRFRPLASLLVPAAVAAGIFFFSMFSSVSLQPEKLLNNHPLISKQQPAQPETGLEVPAGFLPPEAIAQIPAASEKTPDAVIQFLNNYKLSEFELGFYRALKSGQLFQIAESILRETGYEIIQLQELPGFVRGRFGVLEYPSGASGKMSYFLMWRPPLAVNDFRYAQKGPEIHSLQQMLAKLNLYEAEVNGVVDFNLMTALAQFQTQVGLPATGSPDKQTLFLLCQMSRVG